MNLALLLERRDGADWDAVRDRVASHPHEVAGSDAYGLTNLHRACRRLRDLPLDVLELMLEQDRLTLCCKEVGQNQQHHQLGACRLALLATTSATPLLLCVDQFDCVPGEKYLDAVKLFAIHAPESLLCSDHRGVTVLHRMVEKLPTLSGFDGLDRFGKSALLRELFLVLVNAEPGLLTCSKRSDWSVVPKRTPFHFALRSSSNIGAEVYEVLLPERKQGGNLLHRLVSFPLVDHRDMKRLFCRVEKEELGTLLVGMDSEKNTPLHVALTINHDPRLRLADRLLSNSQIAVRMRNVHGEYPLDLVLATKHIHVVHRLLYWYPTALTKFPLNDGLYAWILKRLQPTTVFELLLSNPSLWRQRVGGMRQNKREPQ